MKQGDIYNLIQLLSKLPGLGPRSGRRAALHLIKNQSRLLQPLYESLIAVEKNVKKCTICGNLDTNALCSICTSHKRQEDLLCVVSDVEDLWAMERSGGYQGYYHVLGGVLSAMDGVGPDKLSIEGLIKRLKEGIVKEVIIALSTTLEGQTTAHYLSDMMKDTGVKVTRIAHGVPSGGELDYLDEGTIVAALNARSLL